MREDPVFLHAGAWPGAPRCGPQAAPQQHLPRSSPGAEVVAGRLLTVSSVQMECTWVPNITDVKMKKSSPSKHSRIRRMTVVGGEKELHSEREGACGAQGCGLLPAAPKAATLPPALQDLGPPGLGGDHPAPRLAASPSHVPFLATASFPGQPVMSVSQCQAQCLAHGKIRS